MAKIAFSKLGLKPNTDVKIFEYNGLEIEVKQYLPVEEVLELIAAAVNQAAATDENRFVNPIKLQMFVSLEIVFHYSNITFTEKQKENLPKLYDLLDGNGIIKGICSCLGQGIEVGLRELAAEIAANIYQYMNSVYGVLDNVSNDYSNLNLDIDSLREKLATADGLDIVKDVVTKLG